MINEKVGVCNQRGEGERGRGEGGGERRGAANSMIASITTIPSKTQEGDQERRDLEERISLKTKDNANNTDERKR
eukprot:755024-Hanusia_phi.AAC.2